MSCTSQGVPGMVTCTAWHPLIPGVLACGCQTGHVLLIYPARQIVYAANVKHAAPVRQIVWLHGGLLTWHALLCIRSMMTDETSCGCLAACNAKRHKVLPAGRLRRLVMCSCR